MLRWFGAKPLFPIQCGANFCSCIGNAQVVTERSEARSDFEVLMQAVKDPTNHMAKTYIRDIREPWRTADPI
ncbi:hypothetical protein DY000_02032450 [Brassica cretica]|uniref:Uncharacterized protein n=1 Tax=Brassica cretica TaxID=69181 RepID=A0ABQ7DDN9_BRACR|nr:hypothetical protein DY000_02032450 [Brassica cretica]